MKSSTRSKSQMWAHHLQAQQQSGISQKAYCEAHLLKPYQFSYWRRKLSSEQPSSPLVQTNGKAASQSSFIPVSMDTASLRQTSLTLHFSDGVQLSGITEQTMPVAQQLIGTLR